MGFLIINPGLQLIDIRFSGFKIEPFEISLHFLNKFCILTFIQITEALTLKRDL